MYTSRVFNAAIVILRFYNVLHACKYTNIRINQLNTHSVHIRIQNARYRRLAWCIFLLRILLDGNWLSSRIRGALVTHVRLCARVYMHRSRQACVNSRFDEYDLVASRGSFNGISVLPKREILNFKTRNSPVRSKRIPRKHVGGKTSCDFSAYFFLQNRYRSRGNSSLFNFFSFSTTFKIKFKRLTWHVFNNKRAAIFLLDFLLYYQNKTLCRDSKSYAGVSVLWVLHWRVCVYLYVYVCKRERASRSLLARCRSGVCSSIVLCYTDLLASSLVFPNVTGLTL